MANKNAYLLVCYVFDCSVSVFFHLPVHPSFCHRCFSCLECL